MTRAQKVRKRSAELWRKGLKFQDRQQGIIPDFCDALNPCDCESQAWAWILSGFDGASLVLVMLEDNDGSECGKM